MSRTESRVIVVVSALFALVSFTLAAVRVVAGGRIDVVAALVVAGLANTLLVLMMWNDAR